MSAVVVAYALGTVYVGKKDLSVPKRAQRFGWNYNYGFHELENAERPFRWTARVGVTVVPVGGRTFVLKIWSADPAVTRQPVHAKVWVDDRLVLDERLAHPFPIERRIALPPGEKRMIVRTWVNRTWSPQDAGLARFPRAGAGRRRLGFSGLSLPKGEVLPCPALSGAQGRRPIAAKSR